MYLTILITDSNQYYLLVPFALLNSLIHPGYFSSSKQSKQTKDFVESFPLVSTKGLRQFLTTASYF